MKIGIVSDIHAHIQPLKQAKALFDAHGVSQILCAGDSIDGGWHEEAVIDYVRKHQIVSVRGNHDREAGEDYTDFGDYESDEIIDAHRFQYVSSLPVFKRFLWEGLKVYITHGAPWSDTYHVFPTASEDICKRVLEEANADIVILGHTHIPMKLKLEDKWILNSGAIAGNRETLQRTCGILELPQKTFDVYDVQTQKRVVLDTIHISTTRLD